MLKHPTMQTHIDDCALISSYRHAVISNELSPQLAFWPQKNRNLIYGVCFLTKPRWRLANFQYPFASQSPSQGISS